MKIDLHTHSVMSGHAYSTISEMAAVAAERGLKYLAITDHGPAGIGLADKSYFNNFNRMPKELSGVKILAGIEANVINDNGEVDLPDDVLEKMDVVVAGFHPTAGYIDQGIEKNTEAAIKLVKNPHVKILSHPYAKYFELDLDKLIPVALENGVIPELNVSYFGINDEMDEGIIKTAKLIKALGGKVLFNSDAHGCHEVGDFSKFLENLDRLGLEKEDILNYDLEATLKFLGIDE